ncbi:unnamed protein product [marine sediment metagenome]|uniref:Uncharacterized protein n=1 Tax=marine sediment metagenome TaxID=412755 RepID=X1FSC3_9ZZZZ
MVGEYIQKTREQLQLMRGQLMGGLKLGDNLFASNPGILANFQLGKRIQERVQTLKGTAIYPLTGGRTRKRGSGQKVFIDSPGASERFISV